MFNRRIIRFSAKYLLLFELVIRRIKDRLLTVELELLGLSVPRLLICADQEEIKLSVFRWSSVVILQNEPVSVGLRRFVLSSLQNQKAFDYAIINQSCHSSQLTSGSQDPPSYMIAPVI